MIVVEASVDLCVYEPTFVRDFFPLGYLCNSGTRLNFQNPKTALERPLNSAFASLLLWLLMLMCFCVVGVCSLSAVHQRDIFSDRPDRLFKILKRL